MYVHISRKLGDQKDVLCAIDEIRREEVTFTEKVGVDKRGGDFSWGGHIMCIINPLRTIITNS